MSADIRAAFDAGYLAAEFECQRGNPVHGPSDETERDQAFARWRSSADTGAANGT